MRKPRLLDLFCGAGGAAVGYHRAGFEVVGVDIEPQPNYPFEFIQDDALELLSTSGAYSWGWGWWDTPPFDAIHASPPCQAYSAITGDERRADHPDLVGPTRELLEATDLPYVIENVPGAPLHNPIQICGSGLGLRVRRHRLFEANFALLGVPCSHGWQRSNNNRIRSGYIAPENAVVPVYGGGQAGFDVATCRKAMGIPWMSTDELNKAIPPAYTEHIGGYLMAHLHEQEKAAA